MDAAITVSAWRGRHDLWKVSHTNGAFSAPVLSDTSRKTVDKLVFGQGDNIAFVVPLFAGTFQQTVAAARVTLKGTMRCHLIERGRDQTLAFEIVLISQGGIVKLDEFSASGWKTEEPSAPADLFHAKVFLRHKEALDDLPPFAAACGLQKQRGTRTYQTELHLAGAEGGVRTFVFNEDVPLGDDIVTVFPGLKERVGEKLEPFRFSAMTVEQPNPTGQTAATWRSDHWIALVGGVRVNTMINAWNTLVAKPVVAALDRVRANSISFLPRFEGKNLDKKFATIVYSLIEATDEQELEVNDFALTFSANPVATKVTIVPRRFDIPEVKDLKWHLEGLRDRNGATVIWSGSVSKKTGHDNDIVARPFDWQLQPDKSASASRIQISGVELTLGASESNLEPGSLTGTYTGSPLAPIVDADIAFLLPIAGLLPEGQDPVPDEEYLNRIGTDDEALFRRPEAFTIDLKPPQDQKLLLKVEEAVSRDRSHEVNVELLQQKESTTGFDLIILDAAPMLVARVRANELLGSTAASSGIAQWSSRSGASWQFAGAEKGFDLILPPQVLGETMERYRGDFELDAGTNRLRPADFRFSPLSIARVTPTDFEQRLAEPPWNLRRVLGYPGQRLPGAALTTLSFELVYGLAGSVRPNGVRITEIAARLGRPPAALRRVLPWRSGPDQNETFEHFRKRWTEIALAVRSRLGVLELYRHGDTKPLALTEADGLLYRFRLKSELRYPIAGAALPTDFVQGELRGGWAWGFESANIVNAVWMSKRSGTALLERPFLSSLGGWGKTMGRFDEERSAIWGETAMGRTFSLTIERIGRIAVYWNRAKHVIVYERTVAPSEQFHASQDRLEGVPVLRKVREYVEILEPIRSFAGEEQRNRGFIEASQFPPDAPRISVDSRWGTDIPTGWKVPLWQRNLNSPVYPKPQVLLQVAGERPGESIPVTIDEPEKLYFYTNTQAGLGADTNRWPSVEGVDYASVAGAQPPSHDFGTTKPKANDVPDSRVPSGASAFTFALKPATQRVNVVAGRSSEAIGSVLANVTAMRGPLTNAVPGLDAVVDDAVRLIEQAAGKFKEGEKYADAIARVEAAVANLKLADLKSQIPDPAKLCEQLKSDLVAEFDRVKAQVRAELDAAFRAFTEAAVTEAERVHDLALSEAKAKTKAAIKGGAESAHRLIALVAGAKGHLDESIAEANLSAKRMAAELNARLDAVEAIVAEGGPWAARQARLEHACEVLARHAEDAIGGVERAAEMASRSVAAGRATKVLLEIRKQLRVARERILALRALVRDLGTSTAAEIRAVTTQIRQAVKQGVAAVANQLKMIQDFVDANVKPATLDMEVDRIRGLLEGTVDAATDAKQLGQLLRDQIKTETAQLAKAIDEHITKIREAIPTKVAALCALLPSQADIIDALDSVGAGLKKRLEEAFKEAIAKGLPVDPDVFLGAIRDAAESLGRGLGEIVAPLQRAVATSAEKVLQLIRALGEPPKLPNLSFQLPDLGYYFIGQKGGPAITLPHVDLTPVLAAFGKGLQSAAEALSFELPTLRLTDRIQPFELQRFDLPKIFPDFSGLQLGGLFENLKLPAIANDQVRVTHGIDPHTRSGWVQLDIDVPYGSKSTPVFSILGLTLTIANARFTARSRMETTLGSPPRQNFQGQIVGDWALTAGGYKLVTLEQTRLRFDDHGNIRFEVSADRVKLDGVLQFLSDLISKFGYSDSGFSIGLMPTGIRSVLDLPLPDVQAGSFGLANLRLGCIFELDFGGDFMIRSRLFVARKQSPFTMTIFILGGAGWLDVLFTYFPSTKVFRTEVSVGITAAASLAIALGPIKGGVYAYFGIVVEYRADSGTGASNLAIGLMLLFRGEVSLLGFISVSLSLLLEAQYQSGGGLVGRGHVSYSIKICWCVTINVSASVEYRFGGGGNRSALREADEDRPTFADAATRYVAMFEEEA